MADFQQAVNFVLSHEGGYVNNPNDPGGQTNFGITQNDLIKTASTYDIKAMSREQAIGWYLIHQWTPSQLQQVDDKYQSFVNKVFDMYVNFGPVGTLEVLQKATNCFLKSSHEILIFMEQFNPNILAMPPAHAGAQPYLMSLIKLYCIEKRIELVKRNPKEKVFLDGWIVRDLDG